MTVTIANPLVALGIALGILLSLATIFAYLGDGRWRTKKDDHEFRSQVSGKIGALELEVARHETRLNEGDRTMARVEGILQANSNTLSQIQAHVARIDGQCAARSTVEVSR